VTNAEHTESLLDRMRTGRRGEAGYRPAVRG
jgi:hypothetical protein